MIKQKIHYSHKEKEAVIEDLRRYQDFKGMKNTELAQAIGDKVTSARLSNYFVSANLPNSATTHSIQDFLNRNPLPQPKPEDLKIGDIKPVGGGDKIDGNSTEKKGATYNIKDSFGCMINLTNVYPYFSGNIVAFKRDGAVIAHLPNMNGCKNNKEKENNQLNNEYPCANTITITAIHANAPFILMALVNTGLCIKEKKRIALFQII